MTKVEEYYSDLGNLTEQEKDSVLRGLLLALANCPVYGSYDFENEWYKWRDKVDYYLSYTTFSKIMRMMLEMNRLRYIKKMLGEMKEPLLKSKDAYIIIDRQKYVADFLYSAISLIDDKDLENV